MTTLPLSQIRVRSGTPASLFTGNRVPVASGLSDLDPSVMRGMLRSPNASAVRSGAYSPKTSRAFAGRTSGTTMVSGALGGVQDSVARRGVAGTRHPYRTPEPAGLDRSRRVSLLGTPAWWIIQSAAAKTPSVMANPRQETDFRSPLAVRPIPTTYAMSEPMSGVLPGTPRMGKVVPIVGGPRWYGGPGASIPPGFRPPTGAVTITGGATAGLVAPRPASAGGNLVRPTGAGSNVISMQPTPFANPSYLAPQSLPTVHPGTAHSFDESGEPAYETSPEYPSYESPWGYGGAERIESPVAESLALPSRRMGLVGGLAAAAVALLLFGRRKR